MQPANVGPRWPYRGAVAVAMVGALVTAGLVVLTATLNANNERHLLNLRGKEVAAALTAVLPDIQTPLGAAAALADATGGNAAKFKRFAAPYVGPAGRTFVTMSLWRTADLAKGPLAVAGAPPELTGAAAVRFLSRATSRPTLSVVGLLSASQPRLGYAYSGLRMGPFIAYAAAALPKDRFTKLTANSAYSNLDLAIYLGRTTRPSSLLVANIRPLPLSGRHTMVTVPFGDSFLTIALAARQPLGGVVPERLPWVIAVLGALLTLGAALLTAQLIRGRRRAQQLADQNRLLYDEQRGISETIQHALLPEVLPRFAEVEVSGRYHAGAPGVDIGGDWYDVIALDDHRVLLVVGDVSGRGLTAATAMAALRFAIHYGAREDPPPVFLPKLSGLERLRDSGQLATVLCAVIDLRGRQVSVTSAGHLPLLMICDGQTKFLETKVGLPVGIDAGAEYVSTTYSVPPGAILLGFTDGLVERRGEDLDDGLERLRRGAGAADASLDELISQILDTVREPDSEDDAALAAIRWLS